MLASLFKRTALHDRPGTDPVEIAAFWAWFQDHQEHIEQALGAPQTLTRLLAPRLHRVHGALTFEVGRGADGTFRFVVSADGLLGAVPAVEALVAGAPRLPQWRVIAFRPPRAAVGPFSFQERGFAPDDFWFAPLMDEAAGRLDLLIAVDEDQAADDDEQLIGAAFLLLDQLIGEYLVMTRLGAIDFAKLPAAELDPAQGFKPLTALRGEFETRFDVTFRLG